MPAYQYEDMNIDVSWGGDFHVRLRSLDEHLNKAQIAALIYPVFDAREKALHAAPASAPPAPDSYSAT